MEKKCDACGEEMKSTCSVGSYLFCRKCSSLSCLDVSLKIAKIRHREKLEGILAEEKRIEL